MSFYWKWSESSVFITATHSYFKGQAREMHVQLGWMKTGTGHVDCVFTANLLCLVFPVWTKCFFVGRIEKLINEYWLAAQDVHVCNLVPNPCLCVKLTSSKWLHWVWLSFKSRYHWIQMRQTETEPAACKDGCACLHAVWATPDSILTGLWIEKRKGSTVDSTGTQNL